MWLTLVLWTVLCVTSMCLMLFCSLTKTIVIADAAQEGAHTDLTSPVEKPFVQTRELNLNRVSGSGGRFYITLPADVKAENIIMENRYWDGELRIRIQSGSPDFYESCAIEGDISTIESGICELKTDGILLRVKMKELLEYRSTMEGKTLVLTFYEPKELYNTIVVLDPAGGGEELGCSGEAIPAEAASEGSLLYEKDVTLQVAKLVQKNLSLEGVKVYLARVEDANVSKEERLAFLKESEADFYIRLSADEAENGERYGIYGEYNSQYYIPEFGNVQLADLLTREVTIASSNRAEGLVPADGDSILMQIKIPAAEVALGYFSNETERELLGQEAYREKLAGGIINTITKACEILDGLGAEE